MSSDHSRRLSAPPQGASAALSGWPLADRGRRPTTEPEVELRRLAAVAEDLYRRLSLSLPADCGEQEAEDVRLAHEVARGLNAMIST